MPYDGVAGIVNVHRVELISHNLKRTVGFVGFVRAGETVQRVLVMEMKVKSQRRTDKTSATSSDSDTRDQCRKTRRANGPSSNHGSRRCFLETARQLYGDDLRAVDPANVTLLELSLDLPVTDTSESARATIQVNYSATTLVRLFRRLRASSCPQWQAAVGVVLASCCSSGESWSALLFISRRLRSCRVGKPSHIDDRLRPSSSRNHTGRTWLVPLSYRSSSFLVLEASI